MFATVEEAAPRPGPMPRWSMCRRRLPPMPSWRLPPPASIWWWPSPKVSVADMIKAKRYLADKPTRLIGPRPPGDHAGRVQDRHHARLHPSGAGRCDLSIRTLTYEAYTA